MFSSTSFVTWNPDKLDPVFIPVFIIILLLLLFWSPAWTTLSPFINSSVFDRERKKHIIGFDFLYTSRMTHSPSLLLLPLGAVSCSIVNIYTANQNRFISIQPNRKGIYTQRDRKEIWAKLSAVFKW